MAQERLDDDAAKVGQVVALGGERRTSESATPSTHSRVSTSLAVRSQSICRHAKIGVFGAVFGEFRGRRRLEAEIHLHLDAARQRVDDLDRLQAANVREPALGELRGEIHVAEIAPEQPLDAGAQHLDGDLALAVFVPDAPLVHLRDRGGGDRFAEADEDRGRSAARRPPRSSRPRRRAETAPCGPAAAPDGARHRGRRHPAASPETGRA